MRASVDKTIQRCKENELDAIQKQTLLHRSQTSITNEGGLSEANNTRNRGWKTKLAAHEAGAESHPFDLNPKLWIWNDGLASKFLPEEKINKLNKHLDMVKYLPKTEHEFKYLQLNLMVDGIDQYVSELKAKPSDQQTMRKLASLRVFRKNFETQKEISSETKKFTSTRDVLHYSWRLFRDKINSSTVTMSDVHNPQVKFNVSKYFEFKYGTQLCNVNTRDFEAMQEFVKELDGKMTNAIEAPHEIKHSHFLNTIDLVLKELNERQQAGTLSKGLDSTAKNRIAMQMVDLQDRVAKNPRIAMQDMRLEGLARKEKQFMLDKISAQHKADAYLKTLTALVNK